MAARDKNAALATVPAFLRKLGDEAIFDTRRLIKDCLDVCVCVMCTESVNNRPRGQGGGMGRGTACVWVALP